MTVDREAVLGALRKTAYPGFGRDLVSLGTIKELVIDGGRVRLVLHPGLVGRGGARAVERAARESVSGLAGVDEVELRLIGPAKDPPPSLRTVGGPRSAAQAGSADPRLVPGIRGIIAVASGKGGVGKSTVAVNLAVALAGLGLRIGLLDADIYGPSMPLMTGIGTRQPELTPERRIVPFERFGMRVMSLGFLTDPETAVIWRGPMVMKALEQMLRDVAWGELDLLVVDMPPGTGDAQLTLSQRVHLAGAVIVTTPQDVALADARKGVAMFRKVGVPILGIVENMSVYVCPHCGESSEIFGRGGGRAEAQRLDVPFLGEVPLDAAVRAASDDGRPVVLDPESSPSAKALAEIAAQLRTTLAPDDNDKDDDGSTVYERFRRLFDR